MEKYQERAPGQGSEEFCMSASVGKEAQKNTQLHDQVTKMSWETISMCPNYFMIQERD